MSWRSIQGHDEILSRFRRAASANRLAHAYLFVGPSGIGKRLFARQLAKTLLCENPSGDSFDSCDQCAACKLVDAGTHPDLFQVRRPDDKHEFPIDTVRELIADLAMKPARGARKIAILDDADDLNDESSNAFLKTLEEPPPASLLILIGTSPDRQLMTIRSRCQTIPFRPLHTNVVESLLREDSEIDAAIIPSIARLGGGSLELSRELADPAIGQFRNSLLCAMVTPKPDVSQTMKDFRAVMDLAGKETSELRRRALLIVRLVVDALEAALIGTAPDDPAERLLIGRLREQGSERLVKLLERCMMAEEHIERRLQLSLAYEGWIHALLGAKP